MSIALLYETQTEIRRLVIAGSDLAVGDFRLKKILPNMQKAGEKVPIFARVADSMEMIIGCTDGKASEKLLELANLVNAILYTQGQIGVEGDIKDIETPELVMGTHISYRRLKPVIEALTTKGSGRLEIIREARNQKLFNDLRLIKPLVHGLEDNYADISDLVMDIVSEYGEAIIPALIKDIDFEGGKGHARRIDIISRLKGADGKELYLDAIEKGSIEVKVAAIKALKNIPESESMLLELSKERKKEIREASLLSLAYMESSNSVERLFEVLKGKDRSLVFEPLRVGNSELLIKRLVEDAKKAFDEVQELKGTSLKEKPNPADDDKVDYFAGILYCMEGKKDERIFSFLKNCLSHTESLDKLKVNYYFGYGHGNTLAGLVASNIFMFRTNEAFKLLDSINGKYGNSLISYSFEAALWVNKPEYIYDNYSRYLENGKKNSASREILDIMREYIDFKKPFKQKNMYSHSYGHLRGVDKSEIQWDKRWIKNLIALDELHLVCRLSTENLNSCTEYLLFRLERDLSLSKIDVVEIVTGLMQAKYQGMLEVITKILDSNMDKKKRYYNYYFDEFIRVIGYLPKELSKEIKALGKMYEGDVGEKLMEVGEALR